MTTEFATQFAPIASFLIVFVFLFAILEKSKFLSDAKILHALIAFIVAGLFASIGTMSQFVATVIPLFGILVIALVFILMLTSFVGADVGKNVGIGFAVLTGIIFLITSFGIFVNSLFSGIEEAVFTAHSFPQATSLLLFVVLTAPAISFVLKK